MSHSGPSLPASCNVTTPCRITQNTCPMTSGSPSSMPASIIAGMWRVMVLRARAAAVSFAGRLPPLARIAGCAVSLLQRHGEVQEDARANGGEDLIFVMEIAVRRHRADAQFRRELAHCEAVFAAFGEHARRHVAKFFAEIGDFGGR